MSLACQILLRPRPPRRDVGTAWIPPGHDFFPIHLSHQDPPPELKEWELLDFNCSMTLNKYLVEYHQEIIPLPSLDEFLDICTLYVDMKRGADSEYVEKLVDFRRRTMKEMLGWCGRLPPGALSHALMLGIYPGLDEEGLANKFSRSSILPMDNNSLELKSWACMFRTVDDWLLWRRSSYQGRVYRGHSEPHLCIAEYRLLYHDTNKLIRSLLGARGARDKPSPRSSDIPLEHVSNSLLSPPSQQPAAHLKID